MGFINTATERRYARKMAEREAIERAERERRARLAAGDCDTAHPAATNLADGSASLAPLPQPPACAGAGIGVGGRPCIGAAFARSSKTLASTGTADGADGADTPLPLAGGAGGGQEDQPDRRTIFTPRAQAAFLDNLSHSGNVRLACKAAGVSPQTAYRARRRSRGLALAWDAALLAARMVAEEVLASRALDGVEVPVFYHGEEVATRRCYSDRLLLAHLARLDKLAERDDANAALAQLDEQIEALRDGRELPEPPQVPAQAGTAGGDAQPPEAPACAGDHSDRDPVPCVPPCQNCGGQCDDPAADLGPQDCMWLGNRLARMDAARPHEAPSLHELAREGHDPEALEGLQLLAFEAGEEAWWLLVPEGATWEGEVEG